jgi:hypothetical protein
MAGLSFGIGVELVVAADTAGAGVTPAWASLVRLEDEFNKPNQTTATTTVCKDRRDKWRMRAEQFSSDGAECFPGFGVIDVFPLQRDRLTRSYTR